MTKIAVFFGGKISQHLVLLKKAAKKLGVRLDLVSYNRVCFDGGEGIIKIRGNLDIKTENKAMSAGRQVKNEGWLQIKDYDVLFFRTTGKHWEEVDLILRQAGPDQVIVDPIIINGKPSMACKAYQMLVLKKAGIEVPKTIYGSLWYLYEIMQNSYRQDLPSRKSFLGTHALRQHTSDVPFQKRFDAPAFNFPVIVKGSGGDRGSRVFKADNPEELEKLVRSLRKSETEEGRRYMLQEYIPNDGDYRVLVLGKKVLGVMKRTAGEGEFKNNYSAGGSVEVADLPKEIKQLAVAAAEVCGLWVAGVDIMMKNPSVPKEFGTAPLDPDVSGQAKGASEGMSNNPKDYVILEVNKGPQFKGFMKATGIDVPAEMVKFLASL